MYAFFDLEYVGCLSLCIVCVAGENVEGGSSNVGLEETDLLMDVEEEEEGYEEEGEGEVDMEWGEPHGDSLTPSQHSQPGGRSANEEVNSD